VETRSDDGVEPFSLVLLLAAAEDYVARGWAVLPLHSVKGGACTCRERAQCPHPGKHPRCRGGVKAASNNLATVRSWWKRWPDANIGIATGAASGFDVLDIDPRHDGDDTLRSWEMEHGELPTTISSLTGGGGSHHFFLHIPSLFRNGELASGVDVKTTGGYIVAPPSKHISGREYEWEGASHPDEVPAAAWPEWLIDLAKGKAQEKQGSVDQGGSTRIPYRRRNETLVSKGGSLRQLGLETPEIEFALRGINERQCEPPLPTSEVSTIAHSVGGYPLSENNATKPHGFVPPGYDDPYEANLDVQRFCSDLPDSEFRMLLFHIERSVGYEKNADRTSISQMVHGVYSQKHGRWIRLGAGPKKAAIIAANRALASRGFLQMTPHKSPTAGYEPTEFEVNWKVLAYYIAEKKAQLPPPLSTGQTTPLSTGQTTPLSTSKTYSNQYTGSSVPKKTLSRFLRKRAE